MFLLKLGSKLLNLVKKLQCAMKILTNYRLHFHEVEYTGGRAPLAHPPKSVADIVHLLWACSKEY